MDNFFVENPSELFNNIKDVFFYFEKLKEDIFEKLKTKDDSQKLKIKYYLNTIFENLNKITDNVIEWNACVFIYIFCLANFPDEENNRLSDGKMKPFLKNISDFIGQKKNEKQKIYDIVDRLIFKSESSDLKDAYFFYLENHPDIKSKYTKNSTTCIQPTFVLEYFYPSQKNDDDFYLDF